MHTYVYITNNYSVEDPSKEPQIRRCYGHFYLIAAILVENYPESPIGLGFRCRV